MRRLAFGELELAVMKIVRDRKKATVHDVCEKLGKKRKYTTVMTVMSRLVKKGELTREKKGKHYVYEICFPSKRPPKGLLRRIQERVFGGKSSAVVSYLLEMNQEISDEELQEMEELIREKRRLQGDG